MNLADKLYEYLGASLGEGVGLHSDEVEEDIRTRRDLGPVGRGRRSSSGAVVRRGGRV